VRLLPIRSGGSRLLAAVVAAAVLAPGASPARAHATPSSAALRLLNAARAAHGAPPLRLDRRLLRAARRHSRDMVVHRYFAHESRSGERPSARIARTGWMRGRGIWRVGENLAWGTGRKGRPAAIVAAWLRSPVHRRVMLRRSYRVVGVGIARGTPIAGAAAGRTYTADFGT
jgi:uncharacterized protein YkwD